MKAKGSLSDTAPQHKTGFWTTCFCPKDTSGETDKTCMESEDEMWSCVHIHFLILIM